MRKVIGVLLILAGIALGLYVGLYLLFIGGVVDIIDGGKANPTDGATVAVGVIKLICASFIGWAIFVVLAGTGTALVTEPTRRRHPGEKSNRQVEYEWEQRNRQLDES